MSESTTQMADTGLTIAIDFDGTLARDPSLFNRLIAIIQMSGHTAVLVTGRAMGTPHETEVRRVIERMPHKIPMVFAGPQWKRQAALEAGYKIDIWIDDMPEYVGPQDPEAPMVKIRQGVSP